MGRRRLAGHRQDDALDGEQAVIDPAEGDRAQRLVEAVQWRAASRGFVWPCALCLAVLAVTDARTQSGGLFSAAGLSPSSPAELSAPSQVADPTTIRSRLVRIDFGQLRSVRASRTQDGATLGSLTLNLFDDTVYSATVERVSSTQSGYALTGRLEGVPLGTLTLVVNGSVVAGTVRSPAATYTIRSGGDGLYVVRQVDLTQLAPEAVPPPPGPAGTDPRRRPVPEAPDLPPQSQGDLLRVVPPPAGGAPAAVRTAGAEGASPVPIAAERAVGDPRSPAQTDDATVIDVAVFYTPAARVAAGGPGQIEAVIDLRVTETNQAYADSEVIQRINLVFREEVDYTEADDIQTDLNRLSAPSDGYVDGVHALRDVYAADLVHLLEDRSLFDAAGIAWGMDDVSPEFESQAFSVSNVRAENVLFAHELGHNMGLDHDRFEQLWVGRLDPDHPDNNKPYPYSYGYVNQRMFEPGAPPSSRWHTIMAYPWQCREQLYVECAPILRFSNADQTWNSDPLGVPGDAPSLSVTGPSDAQRSLDRTRVVVANFRPSSDRTACTYRLTPDRQVALSEGDTFEVKVTARPGCAWTAASDASFLSVTSGASGTGRGAVTYSVTANGGTRRSGTLTIGGGAVSVDQIGPNTPGICTRARQVREAVVQQRGLDHCWEVTDSQLAIIEHFGMARTALTALEASDLAGLTNLEELDLWENQLTELPADVFAGSPRLRYIALSDNRLETLPPGIFAGLSDLEELRLTRNRLTTLPAGIFADLAELRVLSVGENQLTALPAGAFAGLSNLEELFLSYNQLTALPTGAFAGLSRLTTLWLHNNRLTALPPGTFSGLAGLEDLTLSANEITSLPAGIFAGLTSLDRLTLRRNRLTAIPPGAFEGLGQLKELALGTNDITALPEAVFADLVNLEDLSLVWNGLEGLPAAPFAGLTKLKALHLRGNLLSALPSDAFSDLSDLEGLGLSSNQLTTLPAGLFSGLGSLRELELFDNPESPFLLPLVLERTDGARSAPGPATVSIAVTLGGPFEMPVGVAATGGTVSPATATVPRGGVRSGPLSVTASGTEPVTVRIEALPARPPGIRGLEVLRGPPLVLFDPTGDAIDYDADDDDLIEVATLAQLDAVRYDLNGDGVVDDQTDWPFYSAAFAGGAGAMGCSRGCRGYELAADLDFDTNGSGHADAGDLYWNGGAGWLPIGGFGREFAATFEGNGHTIANLFIDRRDHPGLFGVISQSSTIRHLGLIHVDVTADFAPGALTGFNEGGTVVGSYATGRVVGSHNVGGLVGVNTGVIAGSYAACRVVGRQFVGGLAGTNAGTMTASYATGRVTGTSAGGLVGDNAGTIVASYAAAASYATVPVSVRDRVGGLVGHNSGAIDSGYWDEDTWGHPTNGWGRGLTTAALQAPTGYSGVYQAWNKDLDGDGAGDAPWHFGTSRQYPALGVDADGDGRASWQEFGHQLRARPRLTATVAASQGGQPLVQLAWSAVDATHWDPAPTVTYTVTRSDGSTGETVAENIVGLSYTDAGATRGATYTYQVAAVVGGGEAARSALVTADEPCAFTVTPLHRDVLWTAGSAEVAVDTSADCAWTGATESAFLAVASGRAGTGPGTVRYTVAANAGGPRTGALVVADQRVTVYQASPSRFTDHPIERGVTLVKAIHFLELRARIDALRTAAGRAAFGWTGQVLTPGVTPIGRVHLTELRAALAELHRAAGRPAPSYTDPVVTAGATAIRAAHLMELRAAVMALE